MSSARRQSSATKITEETVYICLRTESNNSTKPSPFINYYTVADGQTQPSSQANDEREWSYSNVLESEQGWRFVVGARLPSDGDTKYRVTEAARQRSQEAEGMEGRARDLIAAELSQLKTEGKVDETEYPLAASEVELAKLVVGEDDAARHVWWEIRSVTVVL
ncbi:hypothetical protein CC86DRAFT_458975 [Ophiobolus disseminans]|uniref:Uncharacterized protein n=1 Tax=Ophiobolus disseminans TaxID=1469910 RepID=A0A6A6ZKU7_9PLEO|nr:hypothetical protein CC86DRAFT_458975 [Ophiobolus disseminans]